MKRFAVVALLVAAVSLPACAQHGGSRGGFSGHAGSASHGGFSGSAPSHFSSAPRYTAGGGSFRNAPAFPRSGFGAAGVRAPYSPRSGNRIPYRPRYGNAFRYVVPGGLVSWINPDFLEYPGYYDDFSTPADTTQAYGAPAAEPFQADQPDTREPYQPSYGPSYGQPSPPPAPEDAITIVFNDGRASEQIHNYALTRSTLYVLDEHHRDIPVDEIDLAATEKANRDAGVEFQLPVVQQ